MSDFWAKQSKLYKTALIGAGLYAILRFIIQQAIHLGLINTGLEGDLALWFGRDLRIVVGAALRLAERGNTYYLGVWPDGFDVFNYTPFYALLISQIATRVPFTIHAFFHGIVTLIAYGLFFFSWYKIFNVIGLPRASKLLIFLLPFWLIYEQLWNDTLLLNVYILLALTASWLFVFTYQERLIPATILLVLILQVKPQWAFALALPLVLGRFSFFFKLSATTAAGYLGVILLTTMWLGWDYGIAQYKDYYTMLAVAPLKINWHGPGEFIGYDHSIAQIYFYLFGYTAEAWSVVRLIKLALIAPFGVITAFTWLQYRNTRPPRPEALLALEAFFGLYFAAFIWLDLVWEITLAIIFFHYLWGADSRRWEKWLFTIPFIIYALNDLWRVIGIPLSAMILGADTVSTVGPPVWADPLFRLPVIMVVILCGYFIILSRWTQDILSSKKRLF